jgi:hypothetical protein
MPDQTASRTLVKSAPELWAECSDAASLAKHLGAFGDIRITKLEPETAVAWEGDAARGTVCLEPSGWGTRVTLTAEETASAVAPPDAVEPEPAEPGHEEAAVAPAARRGMMSRILFWRRAPAIEVSVGPAADEEAPVAPAAVAQAPAERAEPTDPLAAALDSLGRAHHRPYSRS